MLLLLPLPALADVVRDGSIGPSGGAMAPSGGVYDINAGLGAQRGGNLFHSFSRFNLLSGERAQFSGPDSVRNVIARVTGGSASSIDGTLASSIPGAALYFLNPAGVIFGPNAALDVQGSFHASSAHTLRFADGSVLDAGSDTAPVLSSAEPAAFGFLAGRATHAVVLNGSRLEVGSGATLSVVGADEAGGGAGVVLNAAHLLADDGRVQLGSLDGVGEFTFSTTAPALSGAGGGISLLGAASVNAGGPEGAAYLRGGEIRIDEGSHVGNRGDGPGPSYTGGLVDIAGTRVSVAGGAYLDAGRVAGDAGTIRVRASESFTLSDSYSGLFAESFGFTDTDGTFVLHGNGGTIDVTAPSIRLGDDTYVDARSLLSYSALFDDWVCSPVSCPPALSPSAARSRIASGHGLLIDGRGGNVRFDAGDGEIVTSGSRSVITTNAGGSVEMHAGQVSIGSLIDATATNDTRGAGHIAVDAGSITLDQGYLLASGSSSPSSTSGDIRLHASGDLQLNNYSLVQSLSTGTTAGGTIDIAAGRLALNGSSSLSTTKLGGGDGGGGIVIRADSVDIGEHSSILANTYGSYGGEGETDVDIEARQISVHDGGRIESSSYATSGSSTTRTRIVASESLSIDSGGIFSQAYATGDGGRIDITAPQLSLSGGAQISASTRAAGAAGSIDVQSERITLDGEGTAIATDTVAHGASGNVNLQGTTLSLSDGARISASTYDLGAAGVVRLEFSAITLDGASSVQARTAGAGAGAGGAVDVYADTLSVRGGSSLGSSNRIDGVIGSGAAGSVSIHAGTLTLSGAGSEIASTTESSGAGGNINLQGTTLSLSDGARISASTYDLGAAGVVRLDFASITLDGASSVQARTAGAGAGGAVDVYADTLSVRGGSSLGSSNRIDDVIGSGAAGSVSIHAGTLTLSGAGSEIASTTESSGAGGNINLQGTTLSLSDGARISASTYDLGAAGVVRLDFASITLDGASSVQARTAGAGAGGAVDVYADTLSVRGG
ncbi:filamentous hemagglutinin N-terminal domain-containing protein, partial [Plasticicumulans acidivorans]|uniref:filamentous hemagglutinin N-terminal domain-containing protein n=1 Tax=Plasticicumulans acidivorans TaxID=886464 RepID=UPI0014741F33